MSGANGKPTARKRDTRKREIRPVRQPYAHAVAAARELCAPLGMREPRDVDVEALAYLKGALVVPSRAPRGEGHLLRDRATGAAIIAVRDVFYGTPKGRFITAHETGHLLLHPDLDALPRCTGTVERLPPGARRLEGEASDAGCEIVMPEAWFTRALGAGAPAFDHLRAMASHFDVSLTATALRALQFVTTPCAFVVAKAGQVSWWACSEGWDVYVHRRAAIPERTASAAAARGVDVPRGGVAVAGAAWGDVVGDVELREEVLAAKGEDVVLAWMTRVPSRADAVLARADALYGAEQS